MSGMSAGALATRGGGWAGPRAGSRGRPGIGRVHLGTQIRLVAAMSRTFTGTSRSNPTRRTCAPRAPGAARAAGPRGDCRSRHEDRAAVGLLEDAQPRSVARYAPFSWPNSSESRRPRGLRRSRRSAGAFRPARSRRGPSPPPGSSPSGIHRSGARGLAGRRLLQAARRRSRWGRRADQASEAVAAATWSAFRSARGSNASWSWLSWRRRPRRVRPRGCGSRHRVPFRLPRSLTHTRRRGRRTLAVEARDGRVGISIRFNRIRAELEAIDNKSAYFAAASPFGPAPAGTLWTSRGRQVDHRHGLRRRFPRSRPHLVPPRGTRSQQPRLLQDGQPHRHQARHGLVLEDRSRGSA